MKNCFILIFLLLSSYAYLSACTNVIVTKSASADGSQYLAYTNDAEYIYHLRVHIAENHGIKDSVKFTNRSGLVGYIPQVSRTNHTIGFHINEHQLAIGETTFTGRLELMNQDVFLEYWQLMHLALQRASTAREAIKVITDLVEQYGYASEGESFSIIDKEEAWILEMVGTGKGGNGAIWVAVRIPDGMVSCHANKARIGTFPLDDPENCLYSKNVISFAIEKGYYNPKTDGEFRFNEAYCPSTPANLRYCSSRVWSILSRFAPSADLSIEYCRGVKDAEAYPLWIKPDKPVTTEDMFSIVRDHYEGTEIDMTKGFDAGPFGNPNRNRPLYWSIDSVDCSWERPISTFNSAFSFIAQTRSHLPNEIGGLIWYGVDDTFVTCYVPIYCCSNTVHSAFASGDIAMYSEESAWWLFNVTANYCNLRWDMMIKDLQKVQSELENKFLADQKNIENQAMNLLKQNKLEAIDFLTNYSLENTKNVMLKWKELMHYLFTKYNDGYVKNLKGEPDQIQYSDDYLREVFQQRKSVALPIWSDEINKDPDTF
ncbi:MAG: C69 family dipeptidase [Bacteroidales bacterium]|nr:C69 family dipeptidase [Bacteroidales bacterium]